MVGGGKKVGSGGNGMVGGGDHVHGGMVGGGDDHAPAGSVTVSHKRNGTVTAKETIAAHLRRSRNGARGVIINLPGDRA
jgi:hypothetical protein